MERRVIEGIEVIAYEINGKQFCYPVLDMVKNDVNVEGDLDYIVEYTDTLGDAATRILAYMESIKLEEGSRFKKLDVFEYLKPKFREFVYNQEQHFYLLAEIDKTVAAFSVKYVQLDLFGDETELSSDETKKKILGECMKALWFGYRYKDLQKLVKRMRTSRSSDIDHYFPEFFKTAKKTAHRRKGDGDGSLTNKVDE